MLQWLRYYPIQLHCVILKRMVGFACRQLITLGGQSEMDIEEIKWGILHYRMQANSGGGQRLVEGDTHPSDEQTFLAGI